MAEEGSSPPLRLREQDLASKVAVISGASKDIGKAIVLNLASRGCSVLATCSTEASLHLIDAMADEIKSLYHDNDHTDKTPQITGIVADIFSRDCHTTIANALERDFAHIDIMVLNAGGRLPVGVGSMDTEAIQKSCLGGIHAPVMIVDELVKRRLFRKDSRIVYISSGRSKKPSPAACV